MSPGSRWAHRASQEPTTLFHLVAIADPTDPNAIYVGGMVQDLFRVDASIPAWDNLSGGSLGQPHDDQRGLAVLNNGTTLLDTDDGGIYALPDAQDPLGGANEHWVSLNENIQDTEFFDTAYDSIDGVIVGGAQDNGTSAGIASDGAWTGIGGGDGGSVAIDNSGSEPKYYYFSDGVLWTHSNNTIPSRHWWDWTPWIRRRSRRSRGPVATSIIPSVSP